MEKQRRAGQYTHHVAAVAVDAISADGALSSEGAVVGNTAAPAVAVAPFAAAFQHSAASVQAFCNGVLTHSTCPCLSDI